MSIVGIVLSQLLIALLVGATVFVLLKKRIKRVQRSGIDISLLTQLRKEVDLTRCRIDVDPALVEQFSIDSKSDEFLVVYDKPEPLVSVCVGTYNRGELVTERCVASLLSQTYKNIQVVVVGDCCTDDTAERLGAIDDPRLTFLNMPERGNYPPEGPNRWMVAGTATVNKALDLAEGDFVCHLDDDDEFMPDKIEKMVAFMQREKVHFAWHPFECQRPDFSWYVVDSDELELGQVTTSSIFYHRWLKRVHWDVEAWRFGEPGDWNRVRRLKYLGMTYARFDEVLIKHYREQNQKTS